MLPDLCLVEVRGVGGVRGVALQRRPRADPARGVRGVRGVREPVEVAFSAMPGLVRGSRSSSSEPKLEELMSPESVEAAPVSPS
mmetsp:Transcript_50351/g.146076  ORF Transcript_50351/g.146076 Transcript_50351/m.146076 type:complete len:84 (-) Transcript_50351:1369-1620(-)